MSTNWPPTGYSEVRAYIYNLDGAHGGIIFKNGALNKTIENKKGMLLNQSQVAKVSQFLKGPPNPPFQNMAECILDPRHALVYFDSDHKPVGFIDVCFECWGLQHRLKFLAMIPIQLICLG